MDKDEIIKNIYFDKSGFGSIALTFKEARQKDKTITLDYVKQWYQKNVAVKKQLKGYNSFVAPHAHYEYEMDLLFINDLGDNQKYKIGICAIDVFSKYAVVVPIKSKAEGDVAAGLLECINKMGEQPKIIYSDAEPALSSNAMQEYYKKHDIEYIATRSRANFIERWIRTFKDMLYKRIDANKDKDKQWTDYIYEILLTYNHKNKHSSTDFTPNEARKKTNEMAVKANLELRARNTRKYPDIHAGDSVRIYRKKKLGEKERSSNWSENKYVVDSISISNGLTFYKLDGITRQYLRHELMKVL